MALHCMQTKKEINKTIIQDYVDTFSKLIQYKNCDRLT